MNISISANDFSLPVLEDIVRSVAYWTDILKPRGAPANAAVLRVAVDPPTNYNAGAFYFPKPDDPAYPNDPGRGSIWSSIMGEGSPLTTSGLPSDPLIGAHSLIIINNYAWDTQANSNLPETSGTLAPTMIHEIGHALGIIHTDPEFFALLQGAAGQLVFTGTVSNNLFGGHVPMAHLSDQESSHFGVRNGLMTHEQITNYPMFMEVELAALVDIGYAIDLSNFFGRSLYDDNATLNNVDNDIGFFASKGFDPAGNWLGYDEGTPNSSLFGVGLHVYGSNYGITQNADLLADGAGGAGIRVDGFDNSVAIPEDTLVTGNGVRGTGLLVSFGSGHKIVSQGVIGAVGPLGIGARFDFGAPYVNTPLYSYGTYSINPDADISFDNEGQEVRRDPVGGDKTGDIDGPLVKSFDLSGALLGGPSAVGGQYLSGEFVDYGGRPIALYIGPGAHLATVNVMHGAIIYGDIVSRWDPGRFNLADPWDLMTELTFGMLMDSDGAATTFSDPAFSLRYRGDIISPSSFNVSLKGGILDYAGSMIVHSFSMSDDAQLLTEFVGGDPSRISASWSVELEPSSAIGFAPSAFSYGHEIAVGGNPVLEFTQSVPDSQQLLQSSGPFAVGPFDYAWNGLYWDADLNAVMVNTTEASFNNQRGGTDALNAPLAIIMRQPGLNAVGARMGNRFSLLKANGLLSTQKDAPSADTINLRERGAPFAVNAGDGPVSCFGSAGPLPPVYGGLAARPDRNGVWIAPEYGYLKHGGGRDYTIRGAGVTFGLDRYFADNLYLGLSLSLDFPRYKSEYANVDARGATGIIYSGVVLPLDLELGFIGSFGVMRFEQSRKVNGNQYNGSYDARIVSVGASLGRSFDISENFRLRPFADWNYFNSSVDSYSERADVYGLRYEDSRNRLHRIQAGLEGAWTVKYESIGAKIYWSGLHGDTKKVSAASFLLDPKANRFNAPVDGLDENSLGFSLNSSFRLGANTELSLEYSLLRGKTTASHDGMIVLRYTF
ncbi:MAG: autotransporter outer membrane beta-barrel domain-containing protein [Deltaproteobacteria bacterium]|nr:autotransporter outer membrane beta-barrel domain-containing protein [Deltaproteobacteria bacterium]